MAGWFNYITCVLILCLCHGYHGYAKPVSLHIWRNQIEVSMRQLEVDSGSALSLICDGWESSPSVDPRLRWYGPDKYWIEHGKGNQNRVYVERARAHRYLRLTIQRVRPEDAGMYYCRGWMGQQYGWDLKSIKLVVREPSSRSQQGSRGSNGGNRSRGPRPRPTIRVPLSAGASEATGESRGKPADGCGASQFQCASGECISSDLVCNSSPDCQDDSDEQNCASAICNEGMIACRDGVGCVMSSQVCDRHAQCADKSDEDPEVCSL